MSTPQGEVYDLGYRHYDGPREGRIRAHKALWVDGIRTVLGIGRGWGAKVLPVILFICVITPALVAAIIASVVGLGDFQLFRHEEYYAIVLIVVALFAAIMAPELLCPDRRHGVLGLYLVRPLTRTDYVAARWFAFFSITLSFVLAGQVVLFAGLLLAATEPLDYVRDNWLDVPRFLLAGLVLAAFTTTVPLAVSAFTTRRAYATAFVVAVFIVTPIISGALTATECTTTPDPNDASNTVRECDYTTGDAAKWISLVNVLEVPSLVNDLIFPGGTFEDPDGLDGPPQASAELHDAVPVAWYVVVVGALGYVLWWRYRRLSV